MEEILKKLNEVKSTLNVHGGYSFYMRNFPDGSGSVQAQLESGENVQTLIKWDESSEIIPRMEEWIEGNSNVRKDMFKPKSGMTFECENGDGGIFIQVGSEVRVLFFDKNGNGDYYGERTSDYYIQRESGYGNIIKVFEGMNYQVRAGLRHNVLRRYVQGKVLWDRNKKEVKLNSEYTATINGDTVTVGGQKFPIAKVREIVDLYEKSK